MSTKVGTKYVCMECSSEFIVIKTGDSKLTCCGKPMETKAAR